MKKPSIPLITYDNAHALRGFYAAVRENIQIITGRRGGKIAALPASPTNEELAAKVNELLGRLQD